MKHQRRAERTIKIKTKTTIKGVGKRQSEKKERERVKNQRGCLWEEKSYQTRKQFPVFREEGVCMSGMFPQKIKEKRDV